MWRLKRLNTSCQRLRGTVGPEGVARCSVYQCCKLWLSVGTHRLRFDDSLPHQKAGNDSVQRGRRLFLGERICVPNSLCADVVRSVHERSHVGVEETKALVVRRFDLCNMNTPSHDIVSKCSVCELSDVPNFLLSHVFCYFGFPSQTVSDNDVRFSSLFWETVSKLCGIRHAGTTTYRPKRKCCGRTH